MQKNLIYLFLLIISCNKLPNSIGKSNEITIISSKADKAIISPLIMPLFKGLENLVCGIISPLIMPLFETSINTPVEEDIYVVNWINPIEFNEYMKYKNILIVSVDNPIDSTIDILNEKFFKNAKNEDLFSLYNLYASNQLIIPIKAHDSIELYSLVQDYGQWVIEEIDKNIENNIFSSYTHSNVNDEISSFSDDGNNKIDTNLKKTLNQDDESIID